MQTIETCMPFVTVPPIFVFELCRFAKLLNYVLSAGDPEYDEGINSE